MPSRAVKEQLVDDVNLWRAEGLISDETLAILRERYQASDFGVATIIKYLGIAGGVQALFGLLGLVAAMAGQLGAAVVVLAAATAHFYFGLRLSSDPLGRYAISSKAILAVGALAMGAGMAFVWSTAGMEAGKTILLTGALWLPLVGFLAYRFRNPFLLMICLLGFFHWVGSSSQMFGRSGYEFEIQDPRVMAAMSLLIIGAGVLHERSEWDQTPRFFRSYETLGLLYLNLSLLILSSDFIYRNSHRVIFYVALLTAATLGQIVVGARLKNGLFLGFGITFFAIDLYTRYFEYFWDDMDKGLFFLAGGAVLFAFGFFFERHLSRAAVPS